MQTTKLVQQPLSISYRSTLSLKRDPKNPRIHSDKQVRQIAQSIEIFGFNVPILVDRDMKIIAGHGRVAAARLLQMDKVPIIRLEHLSEHQRRAFMIADNRLTENALWDERLLGEQLKILSEAEIDFSLEVTGFDVPEIDLYIEGLSSVPESEPDPADELPKEVASKVSQAGDLWQLGNHRVLCADSLQSASYEKLMNGRKAHAVFADPPYNVPIDGHASGLGKIRHQDFAMASGEMSPDQFTIFLTQAMKAATAHSVNGSVHFYCMDWRHMGELLAASRAVHIELKNVCVWVKDNGGMGSFYRSQHELVFVFKNGKNRHRNNIQLGQFGRCRTNVWNYPGSNSFSRLSGEENLLALHPTVKPVALVADAMLDCSARSDLILDPFLGSGTTVIAAERTGRICYGIELNGQYVDTTVRRWQERMGKSAVHVSSGKSFAQVEEELR